jgi:exonuclease III
MDERPQRKNQQKKKKKKQPPPLQLATFNSRTLKSKMRQGELCNLASEQNFDIVAIQEHRIVTGDDNLTVVDMGYGWALHLASATPQGHGGVGFMLSPAVGKLNPQVKLISQRLLLITVPLRFRRLHYFCIYVPTSATTQQDPQSTEQLVDLLSATIMALPVRDVVAVGGDFNATLHQQSQHVLFPLGIENANSPLLQDLLVRCNLIPLNAHFQKAQQRLVTFDGPNNRHTRLDFILVRENWRKVFTNCETLRPKVVVSDHRMVFATLQEKLLYQPGKAKKCPPQPYWPALLDCNVKADFVERVNNEVNGAHTFDALVTAISTAASETLPKMRKKEAEKCLWKDDGDIGACRQVVLQRATSSPPDKAPRTQLEAEYDRKLEERVAEQINQINVLHSQSKTNAVWRAIDNLTQRKARAKIRLHADSDAQKAEILSRHFQQLLNNPSTTTTLQAPPGFTPPRMQYDTDPITMEELQSAVKGMHSYKAPGPDGIPVAAYKTLVLKHLLPIMNAVLSGESPPPEWLVANVVAIPKKGDLTEASNYRGISLMSTAAKLYNRVLLRRLQCLDKHLLPNQCGFREGRGTVEQILAARLLIDRCRSRKSTSTIVFVDFSKAFDSINRDALRQILLLYGVAAPLVNAIMALYQGTTSRVRLDHTTISSSFPTTTGVLQGDTLAPFLFVIVVDYVLRCTFPTGQYALVISDGVRIGALAYADDIATLSPDPPTAQKLLTKLSEEAAKVGLVINIKKTEYMVFPPDTAHTNLTVYDKAIRQVNSFTYLGMEVSDSQAAFQARRRQAWAAAAKLHKVFHSNITENLKVRLFQATVECVLLYGCETLTISKTLGKEIDSAHSALLRHALAIHWPQRVSNTEVYLRANSPRCCQIIRSKRIRLYGHLLRQPRDTPAGLILQTQPTEKYRVGGHRRFTYEKMLAEDLALLNANTSQAADKKKWFEVCESALQL